MEKIVIGSRDGELAMAQAESVAIEIKRMCPGIEICVKQIVTQDKSSKDSKLENIDGLGIFTKELEEALLDKRIDMAVHSLKDMATEIPPELYLAAVTKRVDPRDVFISKGKKSLDIMPSGAKIITDSLRRAIQLKTCYPKLEICNIKGNIFTLMHKVAKGHYDGVILAGAQLKRLGFNKDMCEYLPLKQFLPAAGQGTLAIEVRSNNKDLVDIAASLNHLETWHCITAERAFIKAFEGDYHTPIAVLGTINDKQLKLEGMVGSLSLGKLLRSSDYGNISDTEDIGTRLANKLLAMGGSQFITEV